MLKRKHFLFVTLAILTLAAVVYVLYSKHILPLYYIRGRVQTPDGSGLSLVNVSVYRLLPQPSGGFAYDYFKNTETRENGTFNLGLIAGKYANNIYTTKKDYLVESKPSFVEAVKFKLLLINYVFLNYEMREMKSPSESEVIESVMEAQLKGELEKVWPYLDKSVQTAWQQDESKFTEALRISLASNPHGLLTSYNLKSCGGDSDKMVRDNERIYCFTSGSVECLVEEKYQDGTVEIKEYLLTSGGEDTKLYASLDVRRPGLSAEFVEYCSGGNFDYKAAYEKFGFEADCNILKKSDICKED